MSYLVPRHLPVSSASGVKTVMIPPGSCWWYAEDCDSGTLKIRYETDSTTRDYAAVSKGKFETPAPVPVNGKLKTYPRVWIEFSSGDGVVSAHSEDPNFGDIYAYADNVAIATAITTARS